MIDFHKFIRDELKKQKRNAGQVSIAAGISPSMLYNYLRGTNNMRADLLERILNELGGELK